MEIPGQISAEIDKVGPERAVSMTSSGVGRAGRKLRHPANVADDAGGKS
jgi:hypothetical protein